MRRSDIPLAKGTCPCRSTNEEDSPELVVPRHIIDTSSEPELVRECVGNAISPSSFEPSQSSSAEELPNHCWIGEYLDNKEEAEKSTAIRDGQPMPITANQSLSSSEISKRFLSSSDRGYFETAYWDEVANREMTESWRKEAKEQEIYKMILELENLKEDVKLRRSKDDPEVFDYDHGVSERSNIQDRHLPTSRIARISAETSSPEEHLSGLFQKFTKSDYYVNKPTERGDGAVPPTVNIIEESHGRRNEHFANQSKSVDIFRRHVLERPVEYDGKQLHKGRQHKGRHDLSGSLASFGSAMSHRKGDSEKCKKMEIEESYTKEQAASQIVPDPSASHVRNGLPISVLISGRLERCDQDTRSQSSPNVGSYHEAPPLKIKPNLGHVQRDKKNYRFFNALAESVDTRLAVKQTEYLHGYKDSNEHEGERKHTSKCSKAETKDRHTRIEETTICRQVTFDKSCHGEQDLDMDMLKHDNLEISSSKTKSSDRQKNPTIEAKARPFYESCATDNANKFSNIPSRDENITINMGMNFDKGQESGKATSASASTHTANHSRDWIQSYKIWFSAVIEPVLPKERPTWHEPMKFLDLVTNKTSGHRKAMSYIKDHGKEMLPFIVLNKIERGSTGCDMISSSEAILGNDVKNRKKKVCESVSGPADEGDLVQEEDQPKVVAAPRVDKCLLTRDHVTVPDCNKNRPDLTVKQSAPAAKKKPLSSAEPKPSVERKLPLRPQNKTAPDAVNTSNEVNKSQTKQQSSYRSGNVKKCEGSSDESVKSTTTIRKQAAVAEMQQEKEGEDVCVAKAPVKSLISKAPKDQPTRLHAKCDAMGSSEGKLGNNYGNCSRKVLDSVSSAKPNSPQERKARPQNKPPPNEIDTSKAVNKSQTKQQSNSTRENVLKQNKKPKPQVPERRKSATGVRRSVVAHGESKHDENVTSKSKQPSSEDRKVDVNCPGSRKSQSNSSQSDKSDSRVTPLEEGPPGNVMKKLQFKVPKNSESDVSPSVQNVTSKFQKDKPTPLRAKCDLASSSVTILDNDVKNRKREFPDSVSGSADEDDLVAVSVSRSKFSNRDNSKIPETVQNDEDCDVATQKEDWPKAAAAPRTDEYFPEQHTVIVKDSNKNQLEQPPPAKKKKPNPSAKRKTEPQTKPPLNAVDTSNTVDKSQTKQQSSSTQENELKHDNKPNERCKSTVDSESIVVHGDKNVTGKSQQLERPAEDCKLDVQWPGKRRSKTTRLRSYGSDDKAIPATGRVGNRPSPQKRTKDSPNHRNHLKTVRTDDETMSSAGVLAKSKAGKTPEAVSMNQTGASTVTPLKEGLPGNATAHWNVIDSTGILLTNSNAPKYPDLQNNATIEAKGMSSSKTGVTFKASKDKPVKDAPKPVATRRENECHPAKDPVRVPDSNKRRINSTLTPSPPAKKKPVLSANPNPAKTKSRPRLQEKPLPSAVDTSNAANESQAKQRSKATREYESKLITKPKQQVSERPNSATVPSWSTFDRKQDGSKHAENIPSKSGQTAVERPSKYHKLDQWLPGGRDWYKRKITIPMWEPVLSAAQKAVLPSFKKCVKQTTERQLNVLYGIDRYDEKRVISAAKDSISAFKRSNGTAQGFSKKHALYYMSTLFKDPPPDSLDDLNRQYSAYNLEGPEFEFSLRSFHCFQDVVIALCKEWLEPDWIAICQNQMTRSFVCRQAGFLFPQFCNEVDPLIKLWCWYEGMKNVLDNESSTKMHFKLQPFPDNHGQSLEDVIAQWTKNVIVGPLYNQIDSFSSSVVCALRIELMKRSCDVSRKKAMDIVVISWICNHFMDIEKRRKLETVIEAVEDAPESVMRS